MLSRTACTAAGRHGTLACSAQHSAADQPRYRGGCTLGGSSSARTSIPGHGPPFQPGVRRDGTVACIAECTVAARIAAQPRARGCAPDGSGSAASACPPSHGFPLAIAVARQRLVGRNDQRSATRKCRAPAVGGRDRAASSQPWRLGCIRGQRGSDQGHSQRRGARPPITSTTASSPGPVGASRGCSTH